MLNRNIGLMLNASRPRTCKYIVLDHVFKVEIEHIHENLLLKFIS